MPNHKTPPEKPKEEFRGKAELLTAEELREKIREAGTRVERATKPTGVLAYLKLTTST